MPSGDIDDILVATLHIFCRLGLNYVCFVSERFVV